MLTSRHSTRGKRANAGLALLVAVFATGFAAEAAGDASLPLLEPQRECSASDRFCVETDLRRRETRVYEDGAFRWSVPEISCASWISDDGVLACAPWMGGMLPRDLNSAAPFITFYRDGAAVSEYTVGQAFGSLDFARTSRSHLYWGRFVGWGERGRFRARLADGRALVLWPMLSRPGGGDGSSRLGAATGLALALLLASLLLALGSTWRTRGGPRRMSMSPS